MTHSSGPAGAGCRTALVTGGTSGLGLAMAQALAGAGLRVVVTGRSGERAAKAAGQLPWATGLAMDVRDEGSVTSAIAAAWSRLDGIDLLVNNAGIGMRTVNPQFMTEPRGFWTVPPAGFLDVIATNLTGYFLVARAITPRMLEAGGGRIVNVSMNHSTMTRAGFVPYGPSRAGAESLSRIMAADPGAAGPRKPRNLLEPEIMGPPIAWLASAEASGVTDERIVATEFVQWLSDRRRAIRTET